jgi:hypothetical protein
MQSLIRKPSTMVTVALDTNVVVTLREQRAMTEPNVTPSADTTCERHAAEANTTRHELVAAQGVCLATAFDALLGEAAATDETADDIIRAMRAWRDVMSSRTLD